MARPMDLPGFSGSVLNALNGVIGAIKEKKRQERVASVMQQFENPQQLFKNPDGTSKAPNEILPTFQQGVMQLMQLGEKDLATGLQTYFTQFTQTEANESTNYFNYFLNTVRGISGYKDTKFDPYTKYNVETPAKEEEETWTQKTVNIGGANMWKTYLVSNKGRYKDKDGNIHTAPVTFDEGDEEPDVRRSINQSSNSNYNAYEESFVPGVDDKGNSVFIGTKGTIKDASRNLDGKTGTYKESFFDKWQKMKGM